MKDREGSPVRRAAADFWLRQLFWCAEKCPFVLSMLGGLGCWCAWTFSKSIRRGTMANAKRILGEKSTQWERAILARGVIREFFWFCRDMGRSIGATPDELLARIDAIDGRERYIQARKNGRGVILVTAHMGSFEVAMVSLRQIEPRIHVVFQRDNYDRFEVQRSKLRRRLGIVEASLDEGWTIWIRLRDALLANEAIVIQGDRVLPGQKGKRVTMLNGQFDLPAGPAKLAMLTGAPIVPVFCVRQPNGKIRLSIEEPIAVDQDIDGAMGRLAEVIGRTIQAHPSQWLMLEPAWCEDRVKLHQDTPAGGG